MKPRVLNRHTDYIPNNAVYVGRGTPWGNPYVVDIHGTRAFCIEMFEKHILPTLDLRELKGKDLVCSCAPRRCHADSLLKAANQSNLSEWL